MQKLIHLRMLWVFLLSSALYAQRPPDIALAPPTAAGDLSAFNKAMDLTALGKLLQENGPFTVFAPSDAAFGKLSTVTGPELMEAGNRKKLRNILAYHIVAGELSASRILKALCRGKGTATFTTILGEPLQATIEGTDIVLTDCLGNRARIVRADTARKHLLYHEIDSVVLPSQTSP